MAIRVPNNPIAVFIFGLLIVGFAGFWTGGAHRQTEAAARDAESFRHGTRRAEGAVYFSYDRSEGGGYDVAYDFATPSGMVYAGTFPSKVRLPEGQKVAVEYATSDPSVSRELDQPSPAGAPVPIEWAGAALGLVILALLGTLGLRQTGAAPSVRAAFMAVGTVAYLAGLAYGLSMEQLRYTVQVGQQAWSSPSFTNDFIPGVKLRLENSRLTVDGKDFGLVPNRAHIWIRDDGVTIDKVP